MLDEQTERDIRERASGRSFPEREEIMMRRAIVADRKRLAEAVRALLRIESCPPWDAAGTIMHDQPAEDGPFVMRRDVLALLEGTDA